MLFNKKQSAIQEGISAGWVSGMLGGRTSSSSGQLVTPKSAMALPVLQACVTTLAESVAQLPLDIYKRKSDGGRESAQDHPVHDLLRYSPNEWQTPFELREYEQTCAGLRGNSFTLIEQSEKGYPKALVPLKPESVVVYKGEDSRPYYSIDGQQPVSARHIHHVRWISFNRYVGLSPIEIHADAIGYAQALKEFSSKSFKHGVALSGVLERPREAPAIKDQKVIDDITSEWQTKYGSNGNNRVALLQEGTTFKPLSMSNVDAELINALKLSGEDIARIYKMPAPMVGFMDAATYNNVENLQIQFVIYTLMPWVKRHEQAMQRDYLLTKERQTHYIEFNVGGLLRGNQEARYRAYAVARNWGWLSVNDIRRLENLPPIPGGDVYLQPLNMTAAGIPTEKDLLKTSDEAIKEIERSLQ